jgi:hypothetical protein
MESADDTSIMPVPRDETQVITARPFSLDTFTKSRKADHVMSKETSLHVQQQIMSSSTSSSEDAYLSETPSLVADDGSPEAGTSSERVTRQSEYCQGRDLLPDGSVTWIQALTGGDMGVLCTAPTHEADQTWPKSPDLPIFDDFLHSDDIAVEQPDGLSCGDRALLDAMLASQAIL